MLDGGPSRIPQPFDRRSASRTQPSRSYTGDAQLRDSQPKSDNQPSSSAPRPTAPKSKKSSPKYTKILLVAVLVLAVGLATWLAWGKLSGGVAATIDRGKNQAVFLQNGQTYFGSLEIVDDNYLKLRNVFYVRADDATAEDDAESAGDSSMQLIKRGEEVFGPEDAMIINRDQVVYFENIKDDSRVSQLMKDFKANN